MTKRPIRQALRRQRPAARDAIRRVEIDDQETASRYRFFVLVIAFGALAVVLTWVSFTWPFHREWIDFLFRHVVVDLLVAAIAAIVIPLLLKSSELQDKLINYLENALFRGSASLSALQTVGVGRVYKERKDADDDMANDLERSSKEIRVLGLSLNDMVDERAPLSRAWRELCETVASGKRKVRVLVIDPRSLGAALRSRAEGETDGGPTTLEMDVQRTLRELTELRRKHEAAGGDSFDFRLYRVAPQLFMVQTESVSYLEPYYFRRAAGDRANQAQLPLVRCTRVAPLDDLAKHFDVIWDFATVPAHEYADGHARGVDEGASSSGIDNIFASSDEAARRMKWLTREPADAATMRQRGADPERLWLQGVSLRSFFDSDHPEKLYSSVCKVVRRGGDVRVLVLHPFCAEAYFRSYREKRLGGYDKGFDDYCAEGEHARSRLVRNTRTTVEQIFTLNNREANEIQLRLYTSAPFCFLLLTDRSALVEQYHFGKFTDKDDGDEPDILGKQMSVVEYTRQPKGAFAWRRRRSPYELLEDHFDFAFSLAHEATDEDISGTTGPERAHQIDLRAHTAALGPAPGAGGADVLSGSPPLP